MALDLNSIIAQAGNVTELIGNLTRSIYFIPLLTVAFLGKLFSLFVSFFIGKYRKAINQPVFYIPFIIDLFLTIIILIAILVFPEVLSWIGGVK